MEKNAVQKGSEASSESIMGGGVHEEGQDYDPKLIGPKQLNYYL